MHDSDLIAFPTSHGASALPFEAPTDRSVRAVKYRHETKPLTLGSCIAGVCAACGPDRAEGILRFAVNSGIVVFPGRRQVEIAPRDARGDGLPNRHQVTGLIRYFLQDGRAGRPVTPRSCPGKAPSSIPRFASPAPRASVHASTGWIPQDHARTG